MQAYVLKANTNSIWVSALYFVEFAINSIKSDTIYSESFEFVFGSLSLDPINYLPGLGIDIASHQFVTNIYSIVN